MEANFSMQVDMLLILGECRKNYRQAALVWAERFPMNPKSHMAFKRLETRSRTTGSLKKKPRVRKRTKTDQNRAVGVLGMTFIDPHVGSRQLAKDAGISQKSVMTILHLYKFHPYHITLHQELYGQDFENRVTFCNWIIREMQGNNRLLNNVVFSDEANFHNCGQDGAPPHYAIQARNELNELLENRWIGRAGPINWPARSPDLTPLDFFFWGFIKNKVMATAPTTLDDMKDQIRVACLLVTPDMLQRVRYSFRKRVTKCLEVEGRHFEHLLKHDRR